MPHSKPEHTAEVKCIGNGASGCGFEGGVSGGVCHQCGGMLLSKAARGDAYQLAQTWHDETPPEPMVQVLPYMGKPSEKPKKFHCWGAATAKATPAHIAPERDDYESWS